MGLRTGGQARQIHAIEKFNLTLYDLEGMIGTDGK